MVTTVQSSCFDYSVSNCLSMDWIPTLMEEAECIRYPFLIKGKQMNKEFFSSLCVIVGVVNGA